MIGDLVNLLLGGFGIAVMLMWPISAVVFHPWLMAHLIAMML